MEINEPKYNLRKFRESLGMNQQEFAESIGMKLTAYNQYETQTHRPKLLFWVTVAETYKVSIDYLIGLTEDKHSTKYSIEFQTSDIEKELIKAWRNADEDHKKIAAISLGVEHIAEKASIKKDA
jgi:transcriptional regulator with XRE-family HTH domain